MPPRSTPTAAPSTPAEPKGEGGNSAKALQAALVQIERAFGKGAVMRLGDRPIKDIESIPTGSLGLDMALGIGGLPKGRIIEIYGPESSGKCLAADSMLLSENGLLSITEFFASRGFKADEATRIIPHEARLVNECGEWEVTSHLTWNGMRKVRRMVTSIGNELAPTLNHPLRVMDDSGFIVWKHVENIEVGDVVPVMRATEAFPSSDQMTQDEAKLLGHLIADGHYTPEAKEVTGARLSYAYEEMSYPGENTLTQDYRFNTDGVRSELFDKASNNLSATKGVPLSVRSSGKGVQIAFLRGYMELACSLDASKRSVEVTNTSHRLLQHIQAMLLNMGVVSVLSSGPVDGLWRLSASAEQGSRLAHMLDFETAAHRQVVACFASDTLDGTNIDSIPYQGRLLQSLYSWSTEKNDDLADMVSDYMGDTPRLTLTYKRLGMILDAFDESYGPGAHPILLHFRNLLDTHYVYTVVDSIKDGMEPTFDVSMPGTHSFWSSGLISHNTTLALHVIAEAQKLGGVCAFIDAEHALDPNYARKLGVDVDNLFLSQPDNGEQALEITDTLVRSGSISVLVVDSVAALTPRAEVEGEMGDTHVGLHARLMSQALRKLTANIAKSNTIVIMLNQIRIKIGVMFGNPETTTGGNALKFYASVRLDIRRIGQIKDKDDVVGNQTRVKVVKNKVAPPFKQVEFDILYGQGISKTGEILDLAVKAGIVEKSGSWFSYDSTRIGQGRDNSRDWLDEHPDVRDVIEAKVRGTKNAVIGEITAAEAEDEGDAGEE